MASFDIAVGADIGTFGSLVNAAFVEPNYFPQPVPLQYSSVTSVTANATQPPNLSLSPPQPTITWSNLSLAITYQNNSTATATASMTTTIGFSLSGFGLAAPNVSVSGVDDPNLATAIATALSNQMYAAWPTVSILNIGTPGLDNASFQTSIEVESSNTFAMMYGAVSPPVQPPSAGTAWPTGCVFVALDAAALNAILLPLLPSDIHGYWSGGTIPVMGGHFSCSYDIQVNSCTLSPSTGNQISAALGFSGTGYVQYHGAGRLPNSPTIPAPFSGNLSVSVALTVQPSGSYQNISATLNNVVVSNIDGLDGLPSPLNAIPIGDAFDAIGRRIASAINNSQYTVCTVGPLTVYSQSSGPTVTIAPQNIAFNTITATGGVPMSMITFGLSIST